MRKALFFVFVLGVLFSASFASAGCFSQAVKWVKNNVDFHVNYYATPNYYVVNSYYRAPRNTYYVPPQPYYYGYGSGTYYPRGYYNVYSGYGYYTGPVVVYD